MAVTFLLINRIKPLFEIACYRLSNYFTRTFDYVVNIPAISFKIAFQLFGCEWLIIYGLVTGTWAKLLRLAAVLRQQLNV